MALSSVGLLGSSTWCSCFAGVPRGGHAPAPAVGLRRSGRLSSRPQNFSPCDYEAARQHRRLLADQALAAVISQETRLTPTTYAEAMDCDARSGQPNWTNAVEEEMESMADNSAWEEAKAPRNPSCLPAFASTLRACVLPVPRS